MNELLKTHFVEIALIFAILVFSITVVFFLFSRWKLGKIFEVDQRIVKYDTKNEILIKGNPRNRWDYNHFAGFSKLFFNSEWRTLSAFFLFILLLIIYFYTKEEWLKDLLKVNFGVFFGTLISKG